MNRQANSANSDKISITRIRWGVVLFITAWLPFEPLVVIFAHHEHLASGWKSSTVSILILWAIQFILGLIGVYLIGKELMKESRKYGYKRAIVNLWHLFVYGRNKPV